VKLINRRPEAHFGAFLFFELQGLFTPIEAGFHPKRALMTSSALSMQEAILRLHLFWAEPTENRVLQNLSSFKAFDLSG
jgi:hypothetical protein